ncbi:hypothetical protein ACMZOO_11895 [Catenovulum sp. SX2]|uniref:hypothetical protein n=1 Tax=Catenovulum TaxID=1172191 RepID=UPI0002EDF750|nr:hypothetical protein [Catenovulum agarivorans]
MQISWQDIVRTGFVVFVLVLMYQLVFVKAAYFDWLAAPVAAGLAMAVVCMIKRCIKHPQPSSQH